MYHISVLPKELCLSFAKLSFGCNWTERSFSASINLNNKGNLSPNCLCTCFPNNFSLYSCNRTFNGVPAREPLFTTEIFSSKPLISQLSPIGPFVFSSSGMYLFPPHTRCLRIGAKRNGYFILSDFISFFIKLLLLVIYKY